ncbi:anti-sigma factor [Spongiivirga citrea]|uniref:Anti-sigma factor n=1 Tax=Spongiivirga citrea TaxID=1481457 RepID=A0A6M0CJS7_9FLAO|nr:anti-sigma factor [Spongiivirga citrea]NER15687.1 anti-sigma factor [Spongiivirga citrea]
MKVEEYISSGKLELYVAGALSQDEVNQLHEAMEEHPELIQEIERIENGILALTKYSAPPLSDTVLDKLKTAIQPKEPAVIPLPKESKKTNWLAISGWAASVILAAGLGYTYIQKQQLETDFETVSKEKQVQENQLNDRIADIESMQLLLELTRDPSVSQVTLAGQVADPDSYAKAYWKKDELIVYIDAMGLPEPPPGKVYQVWSLKLDPLTPTSIGLLDDFDRNEDQVFELANANNSEAFGITLEPEGGSESPNLEQLYVLGAVSP